MAREFPFSYPAKIRRVVDGDTFDVTFDLGLRQRGDYRVRLADIDTAEVFGTAEGSAEHEAGDAQAAFVRTWFTQGRAAYRGEWPFVMATYRGTGSFGRWIVSVERRSDGADLATDLREAFDSLGE